MSTATRRSFFGAITAMLAFVPAWAREDAGATSYDPLHDLHTPFLPEGAHTRVRVIPEEVIMSFDQRDAWASGIATAARDHALAEATTTGLSWETLKFDAEHRTLDWDSAPLGGWNAPDSHILGISSVWNFEDGRGGTQESVGPIISVDHPENFVEAFRLSGWFGKGVEAFWDHVLNQPWGHYTLRVYYTTIVPAVD